MRLWFMRDDDGGAGSWRIFYDSPREHTSRGDDDTKYWADSPGQLGHHEVREVAEIIGVEIEPGEGLLVDLHAHLIGAQSEEAYQRNADLRCPDE